MTATTGNAKIIEYSGVKRLSESSTSVPDSDSAILVDQLRQRLVRTTRRLCDQISSHEHREQLLINAVTECTYALEESISLLNIHGVTYFPNSITSIANKYKVLLTNTLSLDELDLLLATTIHTNTTMNDTANNNNMDISDTSHTTIAATNQLRSGLMGLNSLVAVVTDNTHNTLPFNTNNTNNNTTNTNNNMNDLNSQLHSLNNLATMSVNALPLAMQTTNNTSANTTNNNTTTSATNTTTNTNTNNTNNTATSANYIDNNITTNTTTNTTNTNTHLFEYRNANTMASHTIIPPPTIYTHGNQHPIVMYPRGLTMDVHNVNTTNIHSSTTNTNVNTINKT